MVRSCCPELQVCSGAAGLELQVWNCRSGPKLPVAASLVRSCRSLQVWSGAAGLELQVRSCRSGPKLPVAAGVELRARVELGLGVD